MPVSTQVAVRIAYYVAKTSGEITRGTGAQILGSPYSLLLLEEGSIAATYSISGDTLTHE